MQRLEILFAPRTALLFQGVVFDRSTASMQSLWMSFGLLYEFVSSEHGYFRGHHETRAAEQSGSRAGACKDDADRNPDEFYGARYVYDVYEAFHGSQEQRNTGTEAVLKRSLN